MSYPIWALAGSGSHVAILTSDLMDGLVLIVRGTLAGLVDGTSSHVRARLAWLPMTVRSRSHLSFRWCGMAYWESMGISFAGEHHSLLSRTSASFWLWCVGTQS